MDISEYNATNSAYDKKYEKGYGLIYPDGHIIRINEHVLKYELGFTGGKILDFGCGVGQHLEYFERNGYTPFGCDIAENAIKQCKSRLPNYSENFHVTSNVPNLKNLFTEEFDVIFSNQVLYYLSDEDISNLVSQFYNMLKPGGVFFATMMAPGNYMFKNSESTENEFRKCTLKGRVNDTTYVNFKTKEEMLELFSTFKKIQVGFYTSILREQEGPTDHLIFVGKKE